MDLQSRARGVMLGLACGDALGAPIEFKSRQEIAALYPYGLRDFTPGGWLNVEPGELTDDSRMAIDLAEELAVPGDPNLAALAKRFVAWVAEGPKDVGNTTRLAISHLANGTSWSEAGELALQTMGERGAASNGSLMRTAPVGIRYFSDPGRLVEMARSTSLITHAEPRCQWSCVVLNQGIAHLLNGGSLDDLIEASIAGISLATVVETVTRSRTVSASDLNGRGYVLNGLGIAFWAVLNHDTLEDAIVAAVMIGDDTDTNAAITGALAGSFFGVDAIPERWLELVHQREYLTDLADRLLHSASS